MKYYYLDFGPRRPFRRFFRKHFGVRNRREGFQLAIALIIGAGFGVAMVFVLSYSGG